MMGEGAIHGSGSGNEKKKGDQGVAHWPPPMHDKNFSPASDDVTAVGTWAAMPGVVPHRLWDWPHAALVVGDYAPAHARRPGRPAERELSSRPPGPEIPG